jgi:hypothetical protein
MQRNLFEIMWASCTTLQKKGERDSTRRETADAKA